jgi:hypothetical protein
MPTKTRRKNDDVVRRKRLDQFANDAERARREYSELEKAVDEKTARLRKQRLEALESAPSPGAKRKARRLPTTGRARAEPSAKRNHAATNAYRFSPGQKVKITFGQQGRAPANASYRVVDQLPADETGSKLYRIRSDLEQHDRVVAESHLSRLR